VARFVRRFIDDAGAIVAVAFAGAQADKAAEIFEGALGIAYKSFVSEIVDGAGPDICL
jgi:hypothetical protein